jgi:multiple RNA-binding domain-containing protein 1
VMQHTSKTRTWANDDDLVQPVANDSLNTVVETRENDQDGPSHPNKKSKVNEAAAASHHTRETPAVPVDHKIQSKVDQGQQEADDKVNEDTSNAEEEEEESDKPKSDADWLRSKTSRLLGLLDEEEQADLPTRPAAPTSKIQPVEEDSDNEAPPAMAEPTEATTEEPVEEKDYNADVELIRISGRLFLRNLAYGATEADLEKIFVPFGKIDEVSLFFFFLFFFRSFGFGRNHCSRDDRPDRDILYAMHT